MNKKINITFNDGRQIQADLICFIENLSNHKRYLYYTLNETVGTGTSTTVKIYVANKKLDNVSLDTPINDEEWNALKGFMGDALKGNTNPNLKYLPLSELGTNVTVVSEKAIAMPTSYDYINKQRGIYATSVATEESSSDSQIAPVPPVESPVIEPAVEQQTAPTPIETPTVEPSVTENQVTPVVPVENPTVDTPQTPEANPTEPAPVVEPPVTNLTETKEVTEDIESGEETGSGMQLKQINIAEIENKYAEMISTIEKLKEQELEAAKRYNATIELQEMHNEQHASYVQNETEKATVQNSSILDYTQNIPSNPVPVAGTPVMNEQPVEPQVTQDTNVQPIVEPTSVETSVPEPAPQVTEAQLETNWFDMPAA